MLMVLSFPFKSQRCQEEKKNLGPHQHALCSQVYIHCATTVCQVIPGNSCEPSCYRKSKDTFEFSPSHATENRRCCSHVWFLHRHGLHSAFSVFQSHHKPSLSLLSSPSFREKCRQSYTAGEHCPGFQFGDCDVTRPNFLICTHTELKLLPQHLYLAVTEKKVTQINV